MQYLYIERWFHYSISSVILNPIEFDAVFYEFRCKWFRQKGANRSQNIILKTHNYLSLTHLLTQKVCRKSNDEIEKIRGLHTKMVSDATKWIQNSRINRWRMSLQHITNDIGEWKMAAGYYFNKLHPIQKVKWNFNGRAFVRFGT